MFSANSSPALNEARVSIGRLYNDRAAASFAHDAARAEIEAKHPAGKERDKALAAEDERFIKERGAIQDKIDALTPPARAA
jgi:hypothetical protein